MATIVPATPTLGATPRAGSESVDGYRVVDFTFSASYTTGGEALTPASVGFTNLDFVVITRRLPNVASVNNVFEWDTVAGKIIAQLSTTGAEVAAATDLSGTTLRLLVFGN